MALQTNISSNVWHTLLVSKNVSSSLIDNQMQSQRSNTIPTLVQTNMGLVRIGECMVSKHDVSNGVRLSVEIVTKTNPILIVGGS
jgi:hypothetical protein